MISTFRTARNFARLLAGKSMDNNFDKQFSVFMSNTNAKDAIIYSLWVIFKLRNHLQFG